jgi:DNA (cytosine-5)-methyltransferase 1
MAKPRLLDLFCGAGGASVGYHKAGFDVWGVDVNPQPNYPFPFCQADALTFPLDGFDVVHASPPCQAYSTTRTMHSNKHPELIEAIRNRLLSSGLLYVIENVPGAPLSNPIILCGEMFGLRVIRHRLFECSLSVSQPKHLTHRKEGRYGYDHGKWNRDGYYLGVYGHGGGKGTTSQWGNAMGIGHHMTRLEMAQAIPPAYTEYIGRQML